MLTATEEMPGRLTPDDLTQIVAALGPTIAEAVDEELLRRVKRAEKAKRRAADTTAAAAEEPVQYSRRLASSGDGVAAPVFRQPAVSAVELQKRVDRLERFQKEQKRQIADDASNLAAQSVQRRRAAGEPVEFK